MSITDEKKLPTIQIKKKRHGLYQWLTMSTENVLDCFASLKDAQRVGEGDEQFIFVPGTRDDRMLLVAHADTVWDDDAPRSIGYSKGTFHSKIADVGIGADDRAGTAILWQLRDMGHSLLIPNMEERGCKGSRFLMTKPEWKKIVNEHRFVIEPDRRGDNDLVFYSVGSQKFTEWCEANFKGYKKAWGSFTDICVLCDPVCGLNISVGYYNQHTPGEILKEAEWQRTLNQLRKVLSKKDLPRFEQDPKQQYSGSYSHGGGWRDDYSDEDLTRWRNMGHTPSIQSPPLLPDARPRYSDKIDDLLVCYHCDGIMDVSEWQGNNQCCLFCGKEF